MGMVKKRPMYCWECGKTTPHIYTGKESAFEGAGVARGLIAIFTFGMSETTMADHYFQCECCGEMRKK